MKKRLDQYGNELPDIKNLEVIASLDHLEQADVDSIDNLDWYECEGFILVDCTKVDPLIAEIATTEPEDCGLDLSKPIFKIDQILHRYSEEDGFYHA